MKKLPLIVSAGVGFVMGSRAGRGPYKKLESRARQLANRSDVRKVVDEASDSVHQTIDDVESAASHKFQRFKHEKAS